MIFIHRELIKQNDKIKERRLTEKEPVGQGKKKERNVGKERLEHTRHMGEVKVK